MLVIFDCDGVLVDSEIVAARVNADLFTREGYPITAEEAALRFAGISDAEIWARVEVDLGRKLPPTLLGETVQEIDRRLAAEVLALAGADAMLAAFRHDRCVCSNSPGARIRMMLERTGLAGHFGDRIFSASDIADCRPKPAPDVFLYAARAFDAAPAETIVLEDSAAGVRGARAAGMRVVGFTGGAHTWPAHADILTEAGAETVIRRLSDMPAIVEALAMWREEE